MAKKAVKTAATPVVAPVKDTMGSRFNKAVAKSREFGKTVADKARATGASAKAAGRKAAIKPRTLQAGSERRVWQQRLE